METRFSSIKELVEPIIGGFWGETIDIGNGNARVVRNGDILDNGEINEEKIPERKLTDKEINKSKLNHGDIVITMSGNVGRVARIRNEEDSNNKPYVASNFIKILRAKKDLVLPEYLFFILKSEEFKKHINKHVRGVAIQNLSVKIFDQKIIPIVSEKEQERIVALLEQAEELKKKRAEADQKMEELIPALFNEMFGDPATNKHKWQTGTLGDVIFSAKDGPHVSPKYSDQTGIPFLSSRHVKPGNIVWDDIKYISLDEARIQWRKCKPERGDLLYTKGGTTGVAAVVNFDNPIAIWVHIALLKTNKEKVNPFWLETILNTQYCYKQSQELTHGIANRDLGLGRMQTIKIFIPPLQLQNGFAEKVKEIQTIKEKQKETSAQINTMFSSLLSKIS